MLIFDRFPTKAEALRFARTVRIRYGKKAIICNSQDESNRIDPFPFDLDAPIVLVERGTEDRTIEKIVGAYHGRFTGTYFTEDTMQRLQRLLAKFGGAIVFDGGQPKYYRPGAVIPTSAVLVIRSTTRGKK